MDYEATDLECRTCTGYYTHDHYHAGNTQCYTEFAVNEDQKEQTIYYKQVAYQVLHQGLRNLYPTMSISVSAESGRQKSISPGYTCPAGKIISCYKYNPIISQVQKPDGI